MNYNPSDWYWRIEGDTQERVYSSKRASYVPTSDSTYKSWQAEPGHVATLIGTEADLRYVLAEQFPAGWPTPPEEQIQSQLSEHVALGINFQPTGAAAPMLFPTDPEAQTLYTAAFSTINAGLWDDNDVMLASDGTPAKMSVDDAKALILKALKYIKACRANYTTLHAAIQTDPTTDLTAGWPSQD